MSSLILPGDRKLRPPTPAAFAVLASGGRWKLAEHLILIDHALVQIASGVLRRLIVEMPPRHGKSELIGRYFPAWYLGTHPDKQVMYTSYEARQARKYGRFARNLLAEFGPTFFNVSLAADSTAAEMWSLADHEGSMVTAGVGGPLTGKGAHVLIVDDPIKNSRDADSAQMRSVLWDWWESTALTRLEPGGAVIVIQTRWHLDDLVGRTLDRHRTENWRELRLPALAEAGDVLGRPEGAALWPARFDAKELAQIRENREAFWWLAMYQQRPTQHKNREWPADYFDGPGFWFDEWPDLALRVTALDPSLGRSPEGDYSAFALVGEDHAGHLWVDAHLVRRPTGQVVQEAVELCREFRPMFLGIEGNAWQKLLAEFVEPALLDAKLFDIMPCMLDNRANKLLRIRRLDRWLRARHLHFRRTPGSRLLVGQLQEFPLDEHDDGPDALEMAVQLLAYAKGRELELGTRIERIRA